MRRPFSHRRGSVVLVALCFTAVIGIALAGYIAVATHAMRTSNRGFYTHSAAQFAAMGLERSLQALNENTWTGWTDLSGGALGSTDTDAKLSFSLTSSNYGTSGITGTIKARIYHRNATAFWSSGTSISYATTNMVYHRGVWFQCISAVTGGSAPHLDTTKWTSVPSVWNPSATYTSYTSTSGDIVVYGASAYRCIRTHSNQLPTNTNFWTNVTLTNWSNSTSYTVGSLALYKGTVFRCLVAHSNQTPPNATYWGSAPVIYAESTVTLPGSSNSIRTQFRAEYNPASLFPNAAAASTTLTYSGSGVVDSYDANLMTDPAFAYNSGTPYVVGDVVSASGVFYRCIQAHTNKSVSNTTYWVQPVGYSAVVAGGNTGSTAVSITSARVNGYVAAPSNTASPYAPRTSLGTSVVVTGSAVSTVTPTTKIDTARVLRNDYIPQFSINTPSTSGATPLPITNATHNLGTAGASSPTVYYYNGNLDIRDDRRYNIKGPVQIVISGYIYLGLYGGTPSMVITTDTNAKLELFVAGDLAIYKGGIDNQTRLPKNCAIYCSTTSTSPDMNTGTPYYGIIYLPNGSFKVKSTPQTIYGALSAKNLTISVATTIHYDTSLRTAVFTGADTPFTITSWRELGAVEQLTL